MTNNSFGYTVQLIRLQKLRMSDRDSQAYAELDEAAGMMRRQRRRRTRDVCRPLRHWLYGHSDAPYPSRADKLQLAAITQLSLTQVSHRHVVCIIYVIYAKYYVRMLRTANHTSRHC